jgi:hypothetical protein
VSELDLGFSGQVAPIPSHIGHFHAGDEDLGDHVAFARSAIADRGSALMLFGPRGAPEAFRRTLEADLGRNLAAERRAGRVVLAYGDADPDQQLQNLLRPLADLTSRGFDRIRVLATVGWDLPDWPAPEDLLWLESRLTAATAAYPVVLLCAYDLTTLPGEALIYGGLETHPVVSFGGRLFATPQPLDLEGFIGSRLARLPWLRPAESEAVARAHDRHVCAFFADRDEEYAALVPLIREGLELGDPGYHIVDSARRDEHARRLNEAGIDAGALTAAKELTITGWGQTYSRGGSFDPTRMLALLEEIMAASAPGTRLVIADMAWALGQAPGVERVAEYEARINDIMPKYGDMVICSYDSSRFSGDTTLDVLRAHPMVILGGTLQRNPLYVPPSELLTELRQRRAPARRG